MPQINRGLPQAAIDEAMVKIRTYEGGTLVQKNELFTDYLQNGVAVNYFDGREQCSANVRLVDYDSPLHNRFTIANQWTVDGHSVRRADMIVFVNGLPLVVVELKSPSRENTDVSEAYAQLRNYMQEIPSLFIYNAFCVMSDQAMTKAGTITAGEDRFMQWKTVDGSYEDTHSANFDVLFAGMFEKTRFVELLRNFVCGSSPQASPSSGQATHRPRCDDRESGHTSTEGQMRRVQPFSNSAVPHWRGGRGACPSPYAHRRMPCSSGRDRFCRSSCRR